MSNLIADWRDRPTHRKVWALAAPMILSNISVPLVALVDSTVIGHLPHAHQLGAVVVIANQVDMRTETMSIQEQPRQESDQNHPEKLGRYHTE